MVDKKTKQKFLIDTGSVISVIPRKLMKGRLEVSNFKLAAANGTIINTYGQRVLGLHIGLRKEIRRTFFTADVKTAIIGADFLSHDDLLVDVRNKRLIDPLTGIKTIGFCIPTEGYGLSLVNCKSQTPAYYSEVIKEFENISRSTMRFTKRTNSDIQHYINATGPPVSQRPRKLSPKKLKIAKIEINQMIDMGIIRPSKSAWSSPPHLAQKKSGEWRPCGDYRRLNDITKPDMYPPRLMKDLFNMLDGKKVYSTMNLYKAYHQIPVNQEDIQKTAVITPFGLYEFLVMPFNLKCASQTFQRFTDSVFRGLDFVFCYVDDIIVASNSPEEHKEH